MEQDLEAKVLDCHSRIGPRAPHRPGYSLCLAVLSIRKTGTTANLLAPVVVNLKNYKRGAGCDFGVGVLPPAPAIPPRGSGVLIMSRRQGETILIGDDIEIVIAHIGRSRVKVGISRAPATAGGGTGIETGERRESCGRSWRSPFGSRITNYFGAIARTRTPHTFRSRHPMRKLNRQDAWNRKLKGFQNALYSDQRKLPNRPAEFANVNKSSS